MITYLIGTLLVIAIVKRLVRLMCDTPAPSRFVHRTGPAPSPHVVDHEKIREQVHKWRDEIDEINARHYAADCAKRRAAFEAKFGLN